MIINTGDGTNRGVAPPTTKPVTTPSTPTGTFQTQPTQRDIQPQAPDTYVKPIIPENTAPNSTPAPNVAQPIDNGAFVGNIPTNADDPNLRNTSPSPLPSTPPPSTITTSTTTPATPSAPQTVVGETTETTDPTPYIIGAAVVICLIVLLLVA